MDIDSRLREAGQSWRESQGPSLQTPDLASLVEDHPLRGSRAASRWRRLVPVAAAVAAAMIVVAMVSLPGARTPARQTAGKQVPPNLVTPGMVTQSVAPGLPASIVTSGRIGSGGRGWVAAAGRISVTHDGGKTFSSLASLPVPVAEVADVAVLSATVQIASITSSSPRLFSTADGGAHWSELVVAPASGQAGAASFVQDRAGVVGLQVTDVSSSNFSVGEWFAPQSDGTWGHYAVPSGGPMSSTGTSLWLVGGPQADRFYRSVDKARSWTAVSLPAECRPGGSAYAPPQESDSGVLMLAVNASGGNGSEVMLRSCISTDQGASWNASATTTVRQAQGPGVVMASGVGGNSLWLVAGDTTRLVRIMVDGTVSAVSPRGLPAGVHEVSLSAMSDLVAILITSTGDCPTGDVSCTTPDVVFGTTDGGKGWTRMTVP